MNARESSFSLEDIAPELVVFALLGLLLGGRLDIGVLVYGIELTTLDGVKEDFSSLLDALEERIIFGATSSCLLIRVMTEDLLAMGALDLLFGGSVSVLGETKNGVVILLL